jgi:hypothetical protein
MQVRTYSVLAVAFFIDDVVQHPHLYRTLYLYFATFHHASIGKVKGVENISYAGYRTGVTVPLSFFIIFLGLYLTLIAFSCIQNSHNRQHRCRKFRHQANESKHFSR